MHYILGFVYIVVILFNILELKKTTNWTPISLKAVLSLAILVLLLPIFTLLIPLFAIYRLIIKTILKIKHGKNFYGLLSGGDAFHVVGKSSNFITVICIMFQFKKYTAEEAYEIIEETLLKVSGIKKFYALFCKSFGYPYLIRQEVNLSNDCMSNMKTIACTGKRIEKQQFYELVNYYCNTPMPKNGKIPFQILIGTQPVSWRDDDCDYYPVLFKVHHAVADGISLLKTFVAVLAEKWKVDKEFTSKPFKKEEKSQIVNKKIKIFKDVLQMVKTVFLISALYPSLIVSYFTYKAKDFNILHNNTPLTNQKLIGISSEENAEYVKKIREIKEKLPGIAFSTVLITAFSASLDEYLKKIGSQAPQHITLAIPVVAKAAELRYLTPGDINIKDLNLANAYSLILMKIPIVIKNDNKFSDNEQVINRLKLIDKEIIILKNSLEYQINLFFMQVVCTVLPQPFLKVILDSMQSTTVVSILAGPPTVTYYNERISITDILGWTPHVHDIGTSINIVTYNDRLHIGVYVDKALISDRKDVQAITDNIYKYLDILEEEVEEYF